MENEISRWFGLAERMDEDEELPTKQIYDVKMDASIHIFETLRSQKQGSQRQRMDSYTDAADIEDQR